METRRKATRAAAAKSARQAQRQSRSSAAPMRQRRHPPHDVIHRLLEEVAIVIRRLLENVGLNRRDATTSAANASPMRVRRRAACSWPVTAGLNHAVRYARRGQMRPVVRGGRVTHIEASRTDNVGTNRPRQVEGAQQDHRPNLAKTDPEHPGSHVARQLFAIARTCRNGRENRTCASSDARARRGQQGSAPGTSPANSRPSCSLRARSRIESSTKLTGLRCECGTKSGSHI